MVSSGIDSAFNFCLKINEWFHRILSKSLNSKLNYKKPLLNKQPDRISCAPCTKRRRISGPKHISECARSGTSSPHPSATGQIRNSQRGGRGETEQEPAAAVAHPARPGVCKMQTRTWICELLSCTHMNAPFIGPEWPDVLKFMHLLCLLWVVLCRVTCQVGSEHGAHS